MAASDSVGLVSHAPVAVVWCRQVDNEAESPGYTTIPDDFPGRRETLETIRIVGQPDRQRRRHPRLLGPRPLASRSRTTRTSSFTRRPAVATRASVGCSSPPRTAPGSE